MNLDNSLRGPGGESGNNTYIASRWVAKCLVGLTLGSCCVAVMAMPPKRISTQEKALLPPYCKYTQGGYVGHENPQFPSAAAKHWATVFGGQGLSAYFWRMHHYCYALIHMMRGQRAGLTRMEYKEAWLAVIEEIDFTAQVLPNDFILMPEMMLNRGRALLRLKKGEAAVSNFQQAIDLKSDYWPPYLEIAEYHVSRGDKAKAIETLQQGLTKAPEAKALRQRLSELGGAMPALPPRQENEVPMPSATPSSGQP